MGKLQALDLAVIELVSLANTIEVSPHSQALRSSVNVVLDAYQKESARMFGWGILIGMVIAGLLGAWMVAGGR